MKKTAIIAGLMALVFSSTAFCESVQIGLSAGNDAVMASVELQKEQDFGIIAAGVTMDYVRDEYNLWEGLLAFRKDELVPGVKFGLGFKGYLGEVDSENGATEGKLSALAFLFEGAVELTSAMNPATIPVEAFGAVSYAPPSLSFDETESVQEYRGGLRFYLLRNAFFSIEVKHRILEFEERGLGEWERDDTILSGGVTLKF